MQWLSQYGYLIAVFVVVLIAFVFVFMKAVEAYSKHNKTYKNQENELKRLTALKNKYKDASKEDLASFDENEILEGTALVYQVALQKCDDMEKAFLSLNKKMQYVYTLDVFVQDASVGEFFSQNSDILTSIICDALNAIGMTDFSNDVFQIAKMYDNSNEDVSFSKTAIEDFDKKMLQGDFLTKIKLDGAKYIKENFDELKNLPFTI